MVSPAAYDEEPVADNEEFQICKFPPLFVPFTTTPSILARDPTTYLDDLSKLEPV